MFGIEPSRAEANLKVGKFKGAFPLPKPFSEDEVLVKAFSKEYEMGMVVVREGRYFVEPAMLWEDGFAVIEDPLEVVKRMREELGAPVIIVKEVPAFCCWAPLPIAYCAKPLRDAGEMRLGVPLAYSTPRLSFPTEGCWEVELEDGPCQAGFEEYPRPPISERMKALFLPLRELLVKYFPSPELVKGKKW